MPRLIVNADDLGANAPRTHGIFQAFEQGIVTSATVLCNTTDSAAAAKHAREKGLPTGMHLNLTEGYPLSKAGDASTLVTAEGSFHGREAFRRLLDNGDIAPEHMERELRAQVEWFLEHHGAPTHVDSHHNIHVHPSIVPLLIPVLDRYGIRFIRLTIEPLPPFGFEISQEQLEACMGMVRMAEAAKPLYEANGFASTDSFRGLALSGHASAKNLRHILNKLPQEGTIELMVHPGSQTPIGTPFDLDPQRQTELRMLMDAELPGMLAARKIELCSYADLS